MLAETPQHVPGDFTFGPGSGDEAPGFLGAHWDVRVSTCVSHGLTWAGERACLYLLNIIRFYRTATNGAGTAFGQMGYGHSRPWCPVV